jgi:hypothetical protein
MTCLMSCPASQCRDVHSIVVDQFGFGVGDQDVAVLKVTVSHACLDQHASDFQNIDAKGKQDTGGPDMTLYEWNEALSLNPLHLQDWIPVTADTDSLLLELKTRGKWKP